MINIGGIINLSIGMGRQRTSFALALFLLVGACTPAQEISPSQYISIMRPAALHADPSKEFLGFPVDIAAPRPGYTYAFGLGPGPHGIQVEYFSEDGQAFLWYPGNDRAVTGFYKYRGHAPRGQIPKPSRVDWILFKYQANSWNPVTRQPGGDWELRNREHLAESVISYAKGDIFNLSSGRVPYRRDKFDLPEPLIHVFGAR